MTPNATKWSKVYCRGYNAAVADLKPQIAEMVEALKDSAEILFHLGTAGKTTSQDEAIYAVRERVLAALSKAEAL